MRCDLEEDLQGQGGSLESPGDPGCSDLTLARKGSRGQAPRPEATRAVPAGKG